MSTQVTPPESTPALHSSRASPNDIQTKHTNHLLSNNASAQTFHQPYQHPPRCSWPRRSPGHQIFRGWLRHSLCKSPRTHARTPDSGPHSPPPTSLPLQQHPNSSSKMDYLAIRAIVLVASYSIAISLRAAGLVDNVFETTTAAPLLSACIHSGMLSLSGKRVEQSRSSPPDTRPRASTDDREVVGVLLSLSGPSGRLYVSK